MTPLEVLRQHAASFHPRYPWAEARLSAAEAAELVAYVDRLHAQLAAARGETPAPERNDPMPTAPHLAIVINGRMVHVRRKRGFVEAVVYAGDTATGEPAAEWELPNQLRYNLDTAAKIAEQQTGR